jgi:hypothetical protein
VLSRRSRRKDTAATVAPQILTLRRQESPTVDLEAVGLRLPGACLNRTVARRVPVSGLEPIVAMQGSGKGTGRWGCLSRSEFGSPCLVMMNSSRHFANEFIHTLLVICV